MPRAVHVRPLSHDSQVIAEILHLADLAAAPRDIFENRLDLTDPPSLSLNVASYPSPSSLSTWRFITTSAGTTVVIARALAFIKNRKGSNMRHLNMNLVITPTPEGASGAVYNIFLNIGEQPPVITGFSKYEDTLVKTPQGWRFKTRVNRREGPAAAAPGPSPTPAPAPAPLE